eukprot:c9817_g1_i2.p1 GENE.c9817_g1_i2~~c9817_g1_i2.p1  ORF type:complete len:428 (-),score=56.59 c9817_g1_i2:71-1354(-)
MDTAYTNPYFNIVEQMLNDLFQKIIFHRPEDIHSFAYDYFTQQPQIMLEMQHVFHQTPPLGYEDQLAPSSADLLVSSLSFPATTEIVCTICGKCFSRTSNLNRHMQTHLAVNCTGGASGNPQLVADDRRPHRCTYDGCTKTFMLLSALNSHIRLHTGEGTYTCEHSGCGKAFLLPSHLASHLVTHSTDRPQHNCTFPGCSKSFSGRSHLIAHIRTHSGERPHICEFDGCGMAFTETGQLTKHRRTHTGERPYVCDFENCFKSFTQAGNLSRHRRSHTGERPYLCDYPSCEASFSKADNLSRHKLCHTGEKPFTCRVEVDGVMCGKGFTKPDNLTRHHRTHGIYVSRDNSGIHKSAMVRAHQESSKSVECSTSDLAGNQKGVTEQMSQDISQHVTHLDSSPIHSNSPQMHETSSPSAIQHDDMTFPMQ